jgi:exodeoxyribonuclease X
MLIRAIDLETTGFVPPEHTVIELGWCDIKLHPDLIGGVGQPEVIGGASWLIDPGRPIPPESSAIHHLVDADFEHAVPWSLASNIFKPGADETAFAAFVAHSAKFELQWCAEYAGAIPWICTYKCALRLWPDAPSHSNQSLRYWRKPEGLDRRIASLAHRAYPDAYVTAFLLRDMIADGASIEQLVKWSSEPALQVTCHIGKARGMKWADVDSGLMEWILGRDFDEDVLHTCQYWLDKRADQSRQGDEYLDSEGQPF